MTKKKDPKHYLPPSQGQGVKAEIDWKTAAALAECQCTQAQIAHALRVAVSTLVAAVEREWSMKWEEWYTQFASNGLTSLRQAQFKTAVEDGNVTMQIFLGKNLLGQSDHRNLELTGKNGGPIETRELPATDQWIKGLLGEGEKKPSPPPSKD